MNNISEFYIVGFDFTNRDEPTMVVLKTRNSNIKIVNYISGISAYRMYEQITGNKVNITKRKDDVAITLFEILKSKCPFMDAVYYETIVEHVGSVGFDILNKNSFIEYCGTINGRKLYALR